MTSTETEWRAEQEWPDKMYGWRAKVVLPDGTEYYLHRLDEPTARLIAAAPTNARLCEELADALEFYADQNNWTWDEAPDPARSPIPGSSACDGDVGYKARAALDRYAAERAPG